MESDTSKKQAKMLSAFLFTSIFVAARAFGPSISFGRRGSIRVSAGIDDLKIIAEQCNPVIKFYDPLSLSDVPIWKNNQDASIGFLRHSEIKHGRVAMAAFIGYMVQANGIRFPWPMTFEGEYFPDGQLSPPEQWDTLPEWGKWQIVLFVGFLEMFSEMVGTHYMRGGQPGKFPDFTDHKDLILHPVPYNLYDPFGFWQDTTPETKERGLIAELNNGRLAMIGILGFLAENKVSGSVPFLSQIGTFPYYDGEVMAPFDYSL